MTSLAYHLNKVMSSMYPHLVLSGGPAVLGVAV